MTLAELKYSLNTKLAGDFDTCHVVVKYLKEDGSDGYDLIVGNGYIENPECVVLITEGVRAKMAEDGTLDMWKFG